MVATGFGACVNIAERQFGSGLRCAGATGISVPLECSWHRVNDLVLSRIFSGRFTVKNGPHWRVGAALTTTTQRVEQTPSIEQQQLLLDRIVSSKLFCKSHRLASFLRFICEEQQQGRGHTLQE